MTAGPARACPAGHQLDPRKPGRNCPGCRRDTVVARVAAADQSLTAGQVAEAVDAVAGHGAVLRSLAAALAAGEAADVLARGAPPAVGRLVTALIAGGSTVLTAPACTTCGRTGRPLTLSGQGGACPRCRSRQLATACTRCGAIRPVAGRTSGGEPVCERCRRRERGHRPCGTCGKTAPIAVRGRDGGTDVCVNCYRMPTAVCTVCRRRRECSFAGTQPICLLAAVHGRVRPLRAGPAAGRPLGRGTGLRHLLYGHPAPARHLRGLRPATAAGLPARTGRRHLRRLRRTDRHPCVRAVRRRGQAVREGPMRPLQLAAANRRPDPGPGRDAG